MGSVKRYGRRRKGKARGTSSLSSLLFPLSQVIEWVFAKLEGLP
jgi:hypothetical protein